MKNRSRVDIISQMLEAANGGATKTKIMYGAFLSFTQLKEYLAVLVENGLLAYDATTESYKTTRKGHNFMNVYNLMSEFVVHTDIMTLKRT